MPYNKNSLYHHNNNIAATDSEKLFNLYYKPEELSHKYRHDYYGKQEKVFQIIEIENTTKLS